MPNPSDTARALVEALQKAAFDEGQYGSYDAPRKRTDTARAALLAHVAGVRTCAWKYMDWPASESDYDTACGQAWSLTVGDLAKNEVKYCPFCGGKIVAPKEPNSCIECGEEHDGEALTCVRCQDEIDDEIDNRDDTTRPTEARDA